MSKSKTFLLAQDSTKNLVVPKPGLTLLELLVVMTILIALSGIAIATLPGLLEKTQTATAAANIPEIDSAIKRNILINSGQIGDRFDSLISGSGKLNGQIVEYVGGFEKFQATNLNDKDVEALISIGITQLIPANEDVENATFDSHDQEPIQLTNGSNVCSINPEDALSLVDEIWNIRPENNQVYLVFGLGDRSSLVGGGKSAVFAEAPVHFSDDRLTSPKNMYARYLIVVELDRSNSSRTKARYIGTAIPGANGLIGVSSQIREFYSEQN